jgi:hypothetical protein
LALPCSASAAALSVVGCGGGDGGGTSGGETKESGLLSYPVDTTSKMKPGGTFKSVFISANPHPWTPHFAGLHDADRDLGVPTRR